MMSSDWRTFALEESAFAKARDKIISFGVLPAGWNYGTGASASVPVIDLAKDLLGRLALLGFTSFDVFPGGEGEVLVAAYHGDHCVEAIAELDGTVSIIHELEATEISREERLPRAEAFDTLSVIARQIWNISDFSISGTLTQNGSDLQVLRFETPRAGVFRSFKSSALQSRERQYVIIFHDITRVSRVVQQSCGASGRICYP